jgi:hypothetical protein
MESVCMSVEAISGRRLSLLTRALNSASSAPTNAKVESYGENIWLTRLREISTLAGVVEST